MSGVKEKERLDESPTENISSKRAVALKYQRERQNAPQVVAKGSGYIAEQILVAARQHSVPIYQNRLLADMLMMVDLIGKFRRRCTRPLRRCLLTKPTIKSLGISMPT